MYIETWYKVACPKCEKANWISNGDVSDQTVSDVEGVKCWKCGNHFPLTDEEDLLDFNDDRYYENGLKTPN